jgi:hypothetical protein
VGPRADLGVLEKRKTFGPVGIRTPHHPARNLVAIPTALSGLPTHMGSRITTQKRANYFIPWWQQCL